MDIMRKFESMQTSLTSLVGKVDMLSTQNQALLQDNVNLRQSNQILMVSPRISSLGILLMLQSERSRAMALRAHIANQGVLHVIASKIGEVTQETPASAVSYDRTSCGTH